MTISDLYGRLQEDCGFIDVDSYPTGDDYCAMTVVQLTDEQIQVWNQLDDLEIRHRIFKSESYVRMGLRQPCFAKSPEVWTEGRNMICFHGSQLVAAVFFRNVFQIVRPG